MRYQKTEWGIRVKIFSQRYGITLKDLSEAAGVKASVLYQVLIGKTPGTDLVPKVEAFMERYEADNRPEPVLKTFAG